MRKVGLIALGLVAAFAAIVTYRNLTFTPAALASAEGVTVAAALPFDSGAAAQRLSESVRFQTISNQDPAENKREEWTKLHSWLQATYPAAHRAMTRTVVGEATLVYRWNGSDSALEPIVLMAHQDVVPVTPGTEGDWKHPPFAGVIADGAVWGRGTVDDKGALITLFEALEALAKNGFVPKRTILIVSGHDEEAGGSGARAAAAWMKQQNLKALFVLDEGSAVIADAPVVNGPAIMIAVAEKGYATLRVTAPAKGGHSSMPPAEIGTVALAQAITAINASQFPKRLEQPVLGTVQALAARKGGVMQALAANTWAFGGLIKREMAKTPAGAAQLHTTIAPTMLQGSPKENVLPQSAFGLINYRIAPWDSSAAIMERARGAVGKLPVELKWEKPPIEASPISSTESLGWKFVRAAAEAENPGVPVAPFLVVAGTDSRYLKDVTADTYRFNNLVLSTKETAMIHGTNEYMTIANLERMIRFFTRLIATSAG